MKKGVVYTAIFGKYDDLPQGQYKSEGIDYICFSDHEFQSDFWKVVKVNKVYEDPTRNARKYKALPHRYVSDYEYSIWMDGNMLMLRDLNPLLDGKIFQTYDHMKCFDKRNCIYEEAAAIFQLGQQNMDRTPERGTKNFKDNPQVIKQQIEKYKSEGFPKDFGLAETSVVIRKHNDPSCMKLDEDWWTEMKYHSRRDQLSLNYVEWKNNFKIDYLEGDVRNNDYFKMISGHKGKK